MPRYATGTTAWTSRYVAGCSAGSASRERAVYGTRSDSSVFRTYKHSSYLGPLCPIVSKFSNHLASDERTGGSVSKWVASGPEYIEMHHPIPRIVFAIVKHEEGPVVRAD